MTKNDLTSHILLVFVKLCHLVYKGIRQPCGIAIIENDRKIGTLVRVERQKSLGQIDDEGRGFSWALVGVVEAIIADHWSLMQTVVEMIVSQREQLRPSGMPTQNDFWIVGVHQLLFKLFEKEWRIAKEYVVCRQEVTEQR